MRQENLKSRSFELGKQSIIYVNGQKFKSLECHTCALWPSFLHDALSDECTAWIKSDASPGDSDTS